MVGLVRNATNQQIHNSKEKQREESEQLNNPVITSLSAHVKRKWEASRQAKERIEKRMLKNGRQRQSKYEPEKLADIREFGGSEIYMQLTNFKMRTIEAWINDIMFQSGEKPWTLKPTTIPELSPELEKQIEGFITQQADEAMNAGIEISSDGIKSKFEEIKNVMSARINEIAKERAGKMEDKIEDQLIDCKWEHELKAVIKDMVTYPAGILKGPVLLNKKTLAWEQAGGKWSPKVGRELQPHYLRVSPFDYYPAPNARGQNDGYSFERHSLRRSNLNDMKGVAGFSDTAIDEVLEMYRNGGLHLWLWRDQERANLEGRDNEWLDSDDIIDALEFNGTIPASLLIDWGMDESKVPDRNAEYMVNCWWIGNVVIKCVLNEDPLDRRLYHVESFEKLPSSIWGLSVADILEDIQSVVNACARSLVNNMSIASGPQVEVHVDRLPQGEEVSDVYPLKVWQTKSDPNGTNNPAVRFHNPNPMADVLLRVYEFYDNLADQYLGVPSYVSGDSNQKGAAKTASGLSMLMTAASRGIKQVISHVDGYIEFTVESMHYYNMVKLDDDSIKGDAKVLARGTASLVAKEQQQIRRQEFLGITNNEADLSIIGMEGRKKLLREAIKSLDIPVDDIIPDDNNFVNKMKQAAMMELEQQIPPEQGAQALDAAGQPTGGADAALF
ncbi:MAG: hypothetical protein KAS93_07950 [Gammaproteobacteria bacterium]|nr:hypothetical protein [Gammaproteobacteria bacterium]